MPHLLLALFLWLAPHADGHEARAPDGHRGFGSETPLSELRALAQSHAREDEAFFAALLSLEADFGAQRGSVEALYLRRGWLALLPRSAPATVTAFADLELQLEREPQPFLAQGEGRGAVAARVLLDPRARIRRALLEGAEREAAVVRQGVAVLRGEADGWVRLDENQAHNLAARVDLAAALLRARILDLAALREALDSPAEVEEAEVARVLALAALPAGRERSERFATELTGLAQKAERMRALLASTRLAADAAALLAWRATEDEAARAVAAELRDLSPDGGDGHPVPEEIARASKSTRRRMAYERALAGGVHDPLDAQLAFAAGELATFCGTRLDVLSNFDRYLALHGIRTHDDRAWRERVLTSDEQRALSEVQQGLR